MTVKFDKSVKDLLKFCTNVKINPIMSLISSKLYWDMQGKCTNIIWEYAGGFNPELGVRRRV